MTNIGAAYDAVAHVKYFTPDSQCTWYATEFDGEDTFFSVVSLLNYFSTVFINFHDSRINIR